MFEHFTKFVLVSHFWIFEEHIILLWYQHRENYLVNKNTERYLDQRNVASGVFQLVFLHLVSISF